MPFTTGAQLRSAAEEAIGYRLTPEEWNDAEPLGWSDRPAAEYDDQDLKQLVAELRKLLPGKRRPSIAHARAREEQVAERLRPAVEKERFTVFGATEAPFDNAEKAARWIEAQDQTLETAGFAITVEAPVNLGPMDAVRWMRDWLVQHLPEEEGSDGLSLLQFMATPGLREISRQLEVLPYLDPRKTDGQEIWEWHAVVPHGSQLSQLYEAANRVAAAAGWERIAAVQHLLTGEVMPTSVRVKSRLQMRRYSTDEPWPAPLEQIVIEVPDPAGIDAPSVSSAFTRARQDLRSPRKRGRSSSRSIRAATFVSKHPDLSWSEKLKLWNTENPEELYATSNALRKAASRGRRA